LDSIEPTSHKWDRKLVRVKAIKDAKTTYNLYNLHFIDSVEEGFDLVVGADGAWSKVRPLLIDERPIYSGITTLDLKATEVSKKKQWLANFTGAGSCFMFGEGPSFGLLT